MTRLSVLEQTRESGILERAAAGEAEAFAELVAMHHTDMRRISYAICGDLDVVEDAVQQAWQIAWRKLGTVRNPARLRSWLVAVAANETRQLVRRRQRRREVELDPGWHGEVAGLDAPDPTSVDLSVALRALSPKDRSLLALRYVAGLNATEIAAVAGGSASTVRSRLARLLARLREELTDV